MFETSGCLIPSSSAASACLRRRLFIMLSILNTSCAFTRCSSALGMPRSLNTFPLPTSYRFLLMRFPLRLFSRPRAHAFRLARHLAEVSRGPSSISSETRAAHKRSLRIARYNGAECVAAKIFDHFQDPCPAKTTWHLGVVVLATSLGNVDGIAHVILDRIGK